MRCGNQTRRHGRISPLASVATELGQQRPAAARIPGNKKPQATWHLWPDERFFGLAAAARAARTLTAQRGRGATLVERSGLARALPVGRYHGPWTDNRCCRSTHAIPIFLVRRREQSLAPGRARQE